MWRLAAKLCPKQSGNYIALGRAKITATTERYPNQNHRIRWHTCNIQTFSFSSFHIFYLKMGLGKKAYIQSSSLLKFTLLCCSLFGFSPGAFTEAIPEKIHKHTFINILFKYRLCRGYLNFSNSKYTQMHTMKKINFIINIPESPMHNFKVAHTSSSSSLPSDGFDWPIIWVDKT